MQRWVDGPSVNPYYNKTTQEGFFAFQKIAEASNKPVMLYNIPGRTAVNPRPIQLNDFPEIPILLL